MKYRLTDRKKILIEGHLGIKERKHQDITMVISYLYSTCMDKIKGIPFADCFQVVQFTCSGLGPLLLVRTYKLAK